MCSVSPVVEKIPAPSNRFLITAPKKRHPVHSLRLAILRLLLFISNLLHSREILEDIGTYTVFKEIPKLH